MAVALDEEQQYVGFALGQLLAGRLGKRQLRVSVLCVADRQPATARALLAELRSQARSSEFRVHISQKTRQAD